MVKSKKIFQCISCSHETSKWTGKCGECGEWNTVSERIVSKSSKSSISSSIKTPQRISDISGDKAERIPINDLEFNRVIGNGLVKGSVILLGGEPGIGKSTLTLKIALKLKEKVLYISGEESNEQIKLRANRLKFNNDSCYIYNETEVNTILKTCEEVFPTLIIIDSIQTIHTQEIDAIPGSISQIKHCAEILIKYAKEKLIPIIIIGHITKDGAIAGPKVLEHMVDTVLHFEGDRNHVYRILRAHKNRFGTTAELGIYTMAQEGLMTVTNPSALLISNESAGLSGHAIGATVEGIRPMLIEVQALVSSAVYGTPQRSSTGFDNKRLNMLLAVLEKRAGFQLGAKDVFLNLAGGIRLDDPGLDLAVMVAILSSSLDVAIPKGYTFAAEIGLSGELRNVPKMEQRIQEASKLGFEQMVVAQAVKTVPQGLEVIRLATIKDLVAHLF